MASHGTFRIGGCSRPGRARRQRNLEKFVPSGDSDFALTARFFTDHLSRHYEACNVSAEEAETLSRLVMTFRNALAIAVMPDKRTQSAIRAKNSARKAAEARVRMIGAKIRNDPTVKYEHKNALRLAGLPRRKSAATKCPQHPPHLVFVGGATGTSGDLGAGTGSGAHVLRFYDQQVDIARAGRGLLKRRRADGASRIELFIGYIPQGVPSSEFPLSPLEYQQRGFGWPVYLRSFDSSPFEVRFPMPDRPMMLVYWARWANNSGEYGRFSMTCAARVEGWSVTSMPPAPERELPSEVVEPKRVETRYVVLGAQYFLPPADVNENDQRPMLPAAQVIEQ